MNDAIKGAFAHDGKLFLRRESGLYTVQDNGKEPRDWTSEQFAIANEGLEAFQAFYFDEVHEMVNITNIHGQDRQDLTDAIMVMVLEGLLPAFDELRSIRLYKDKLIPISVGYALHAQILQSVLDVYQGCGHLAPGQCIDQVGPSVVDFLNAQPARMAMVRQIPGTEGEEEASSTGL